MVLDNTTFNRIKSLLRIPINTVIYNGSASDGVLFQVGYKDDRNNLISGVHVVVSEEFKIVRVERISITWGRYIRNWPVVRETLPLHPAGETLKIYHS